MKKRKKKIYIFKSLKFEFENQSWKYGKSQNFFLIPRFLPFSFIFLEKEIIKIEMRGALRALEIESRRRMFFIVRLGGAFVMLISRDRRPPRWLYIERETFVDGGVSSGKKGRVAGGRKAYQLYRCIVARRTGRWVSLKDAFSHCWGLIPVHEMGRDHRIDSTNVGTHPHPHPTIAPSFSIRAPSRSVR